MKTLNRAIVSGAFAANVAAEWHDLTSSVPSHYELAGGDATLVVVDMQRVFLNNWEGDGPVPTEGVIRQVEHAMKMGWAIVLLQMKPWRMGETIPAIMDLLDGPHGKYHRFVRCSKQTPSGAKEVIEACYREGYSLELFRITGVYLDACVFDTAMDILRREPASLVRLMKEACATDSFPNAWDWVSERIVSETRIAISSDMIDD